MLLMKKLLGILVMGLLWCNLSFASEVMWNYEKGYVRVYLETNDNLENEMNKRTNAKILKRLNCQQGYKKTKEQMPSWVLQDSSFSKKGKLKKKYQPFRLYKIICLTDEQIQQKKQNAIMFTIKDKREQCEAIGFKPETEKFADCVLRLVELDVKQQQDQKIASARSSGNLAVANQLQQMRNDNSSRYLMDLGQQLLKPKQYNSNIYMPQTQRCTIQGFGSFANMVCR